MPVKILDNQGTTSSATGEIKKSDLTKIKSDFDNDVSVTRNTVGEIINKRVSFYFDKNQFLELFRQRPNDLGVIINIGIQIDPTLDICRNDESNNMCIVVETFENRLNKNPHNGIGDFVLINGYDNYGSIKTLDTGCCPSSEPTIPPNVI